MWVQVGVGGGGDLVLGGDEVPECVDDGVGEEEEGEVIKNRREACNVGSGRSSSTTEKISQKSVSDCSLAEQQSFSF